MKYKYQVVIIFSVIFFFHMKVNAQSIPNYEQIAFRHYAANIINPDAKFSLWVEIAHYSDFPLWYPACLGSFNVNHSDLIFVNASHQRKLDVFTLPSNFRVKAYGKGAFPRVSVSSSFSNNAGQTIVNVIEEHKFYGNVYRMELNEEGVIMKVCTDGWLKD